jgi:threonine dehydrogenase-like Zn-dependent dehydrogenase
MKAAVLHAIDDLRLEDVPEPSCGADDLLIKIKYNGLCGTDASEFHKASLMVPLQKAHPNSHHEGATILGHEFIGEVVAAGSNTQSWVGKRVACGAGVSCGKCARCLEGRTNLCTSYYTLGLSTHGGLAEFVSAPARACVEIPADCKDQYAALAQPLAVGIHGVTRAGVVAGDRVIVLGAGAIGSFVIVALGSIGVNVTAVDISDERLAIAKQLGVKQVVKIPTELSTADAIELIGAGADVVFETSGAPGAVERAVALTRMGGTTMLMGLNKSPQPLVFADPVLREVTLQTTVAHVCATDMPAALEILRDEKLGKLLLGPIFPLAKVGEAFAALLSGSVTGKILVGE